MNGVADLIRSAERFIASGKFELAQEQLATAQTLDPQNKYIPAIIDRIRVLKQPAPIAPAGVENLLQEPDADSSRYLSVTVGKEFKSGVKSATEEAAQTPRDLQARIRRLTSAAESYYDNGSYKNAFDSLMKAYLLDPMSPFVIACEKTVIPAWQRMQASTPVETHTDEEPEDTRRNSLQEQRGE